MEDKIYKIYINLMLTKESRQFCITLVFTALWAIKNKEITVFSKLIKNPTKINYFGKIWRFNSNLFSIFTFNEIQTRFGDCCHILVLVRPERCKNPDDRELSTFFHFHKIYANFMDFILQICFIDFISTRLAFFSVFLKTQRRRKTQSRIRMKDGPDRTLFRTEKNTLVSVLET